MVVTLRPSVKTVSFYSRHYEHRRNISVGHFSGVHPVRPIMTDERKAARCHLITRLEQPYIEKNRCEKENQSEVFLRTLLIDNYDSYTYNIYQELSIVNSVPPVVIRNDDMSWSTLYHLLYEVRAFDNVVISPGPGSPMCPEDTGICLRVLRECEDIPILGVCLGHQALGYVHGANIIHAPEPVHGRLSRITHNGCTLFQSIPSGTCSNFNVVRYHSLVIDAASLPREVLTPIAWTCSIQMMPPLLIPHNSDLPPTHFTVDDGRENSAAESENHAVLLMGIMHNSRPHYGLQFHPESVATSYGRQLFENFKAITINHMHETRSTWKFQSDHQVCRTKPKHDGPVNSLLKPDRLMDVARRETDTRPLKLTWRKFESLAGRVGGTENLFMGLFEDHSTRNAFWLDSSSTEEKRARFSFMGGKGGPLWKQITFRLSNRSGEASARGGGGGGYISTEGPDGSFTNRFLEDGFFSFLDEELRLFEHSESDYDGLPFQFYGGYVGYIGYGLKSECGGSQRRDAAMTPDACFFFADNVVAVDHERDDVYLLSLRDEGDGNSSWLDDTEKRLMALVEESPSPPPPPSGASGFIGEPSGFTGDRTRDEYVDDVEECLRLIREGESYELCLTTQIRKKVARDINSMGVYLRLRENNPAPFAAWLNFPDLDLSICCSSPERFLKLDAAGVLETKPIKGTAPRGRTAAEDHRLRVQLQLSEKDRAENLMIVDLVRNDLCRVCYPGSVHVPRLMEVESYATVHTMVSTVRGKKRSGAGAVDCVRAAFPGGSMTGAPKLRSMAILDRIERSDRGIYSGCIGYFSYNSTFDLNIVIRAVVLHAGEASIGAGGAIVSLSHSQREYDEMLLKAAAPASSVSAQERCQSFTPGSS